MNNKGFLVLAQNSSSGDYIIQSCLLAMSLKATNNAPISIVTNDEVPDNYKFLFDNIISIPFGDDAIDKDWKIENRWKLYHATPYEETIVLLFAWHRGCTLCIYFPPEYKHNRL